MDNIKFFVKESAKLLKPPGLDTLILYVTSRCNAKCHFCFYGDELNHVPEMTLDQIVQISKKLGSLNGLLIGGGEPFLRTDLFEVVAAFVRNCRVSVVQIPTNGFFSDRITTFVKNITTAFPQLDLSIQVSLDAIGEKHDAVRELKGCFQRAEQTIRALKDLRGPHTRLRILVVSVLTKGTLKDHRDLAFYIREKVSPDYHWFEPVRDKPDLVSDLYLSGETVAFLRDNLKSYLRKFQGTSASIFASPFFNGLITKYSLHNFDIAYENFLRKKPWPVKCCAGKRMAVLYPDGILAACELRSEKVNIRDYGFDLNTALRDKVFQPVREDTARHKCDCTHGCFIPTSVRYSPLELIKVACEK